MSKGLEALKELPATTCEEAEAIDIIEKELKALEIIKRIKFDIVYQEQFDEWTLFIIYETEDGSQLVPVVFGSGKEEYNLLKEVLL